MKLRMLALAAVLAVHALGAHGAPVGERFRSIGFDNGYIDETSASESDVTWTVIGGYQHHSIAYIHDDPAIGGNVLRVSIKPGANAYFDALSIDLAWAASYIAIADDFPLGHWGSPKDYPPVDVVGFRLTGYDRWGGWRQRLVSTADTGEISLGWANLLAFHIDPTLVGRDKYRSPGARRYLPSSCYDAAGTRLCTSFNEDRAASGGFDNLNLREVTMAPAPVPLPATGLLLLTGLGLFALKTRAGR
jgi:hypothetical protein